MTVAAIKTSESGPQQTGKHMDIVQEPKIVSDDRRDHHGDSQQRPRQIVPADDAVSTFSWDSCSAPSCAGWIFQPGEKSCAV
jgi:hypothetical protein